MWEMHWKDLDVWKRSHGLVREVYRVTARFPKEELYGLTSQIRRAIVSIPTNIVEGFSRNSTKEYIQFLFNSRGSLEESRYLLLLSQEFGFISKDVYDGIENECETISKMLNGLISALRKRVNEK